MEWYKFDIAAYRQATQSLNLREHGIYRRLLDLYYMLEGPIFNDLRYIKQELKCVDRWDHQALIKVLSTYFILDTSTNHYHNPKADKELIDYNIRKSKNRANANIRWNNANGNATGNASAMPIQTYKHTNNEKPRCCAILENGKPCNQPSAFWNVHGTKGHCKEHGPL